MLIFALGLGIGFAGFYFFTNKKPGRSSSRSPSPQPEAEDELCTTRHVVGCAYCAGFFKVEDGQLLFHLKHYVETLNRLWEREGVWPNRYFYMKALPVLSI